LRGRREDAFEHVRAGLRDEEGGDVLLGEGFLVRGERGEGGDEAFGEVVEERIGGG
jgi:hypothetical protein